MVMIGFYLGVAFGLILSTLLDEIEAWWKQTVRREAAQAVARIITADNMKED